MHSTNPSNPTNQIDPDPLPQTEFLEPQEVFANESSQQSSQPLLTVKSHLTNFSHTIIKEKTDNKSVLQEKESKITKLLQYNTTRQTDNMLNQDHMEDCLSGENKASTEQTFDIEEIKKDIEKKKTHNQSVLQEKESKTKKLLRYNTTKQTDTTLNQDQMEEFTNGGKEVKSTEQMFNVEDTNVASANEHPIQPFSNEETAITKHKINHCGSSAQKKQQNKLDENQSKEKANGTNKQQSNQTVNIEDLDQKSYIDNKSEEKIETTHSSSYHQLKKHTPSEHENKKPFQCEICKKAFAKKQVLQLHISVVHDKIKHFLCPVCPATFSYQYQLKDHATISHGNTREFQCTVCPKYFSYKNKLKCHTTVVHEKVKAFLCLVCPKSFGYEKSLKLHNRVVHDKIKLFQCQVCQKFFGLHSVLKRHTRVQHDKMKPFLCPVCPATFSYQYQLNDHATIGHDKVEEFQCPVCHKYFPNENLLTFHTTVVHEKIKAFKCQVCQKNFGFEQSLKRHARIGHDKIKAFKCQVCQKSFAYEKSLELHNRRKHEEENVGK